MPTDPQPAFVLERVVDFAETDAAGVVHFSNVFRYAEACEHAFLKSLDIAVFEPGNPKVGWPRVHAECAYHRPIRFGDALRIGIFVEQLGESSIGYRFRIANAREAVAEGRMTVVHVVFSGAKATKAPLPDSVRRVLQSRVVEFPRGSESHRQP